MTPITAPDYESIRAALQLDLQSKNAWRDLLPTSTGQTLADWIAGVGATDQYAIQHAFREAFRTARLDSSILAQAIMLGVRLGRKAPSFVTVTLSKITTDMVTIPAYTQFTSSAGLLFNRETINLYGTTPVEAVLYEGEVKNTIVSSDGNPYQMFVSDDDAFRISDSDVRVLLNNVSLPLTTRGLWRYKGVSGVADSTSPTGQLILTFGSKDFGTQPASGDTVIVTYALTNGASAQTSAILGDSVVLNGRPDVKILATTGLVGGAEEKSSLFYRKLSPQLFSGDVTASTEEEFSAKAAEYPGVFDARIVGQRRLAPGDVRWMNLTQVTLLTDHEWSGEEWDTFRKWFIPKYIYPVRITRRDPVALPVNVSLKIYCQARADLAAVKTKAEDAVKRLFKLRPGLLDANLYMSDLHAAAKSADNAIEFVRLLQPTGDTIVGALSPTPLVLTDATGTLLAGQYTYGVATIVSSGETLVTNYKSRVIPGGGVKIDWDPVPSALGYSIYGRTPLTLGKIGQTTATEFIDTGAVTPVQTLSVSAGAGFRYASLGSLHIEVAYTNREFYDLGNIR